jgi:hypothetical protein
MRPFLFVPQYFYWHYFKAPRQILHIAMTFVWFFWHFFSIGIMARTLFAPFERLTEEGPKNFDIEAFFSALLVNTVIRGFGAFVRSVFIVFGFLAIGFVACCTLLIEIVWILMPIVIIFLVMLSGYYFTQVL